MYDVHAIDHYKGLKPRTNNLLTKEEVKDIEEHGIPIQYQKKTKTEVCQNILVKLKKVHIIFICKNMDYAQ